MPIFGARLCAGCAMTPETIAQLAQEIRNLAHRGWEDRPNAEYLFREIGKRAQQISEPVASLSAQTPPDGGSDKVKSCLRFIRQCVSGSCNELDLEVIRGEIDGALGEADGNSESLRRALKSLYNEVHGALGIAEPKIRAAIGNTNMACIERRLSEAKSALGGAAQEEAPSSHDWIHEDELPADYPYHAMFPYSIIPGGIGCRVFPRLPERVKVEEEAGAPPVVEYRSFCKICHRAIRLWSGTRETGDWVHAEQNVSSDHWAVPFEDRESKK